MNLTEQINQLGTMKRATEIKEAAKEQVRMSSKDINMYEMAARNLAGDYSKGRVNVQETITTTDSIKMIPNIITGALREGAEMENMVTKFFNTVNVEGGSNSAVYVIPIVGEIVASEVSEGGRYNEDNVEFNTIENNSLEIRVKKIGIKVSVTEEAITDSTWDIMGINIRKMARAMQRYQEELCFNNFSSHGNIIFDNDLGAQMPSALTTGQGVDGKPNQTLSVEDFIDMVLALMGQGFTPTDVIFHPLVWLVFAKNSMIGNGFSFGALGGSGVSPFGTVQGTGGFAGLSNNGEGQKFILKPEQVQNRLPMPMQVNFSPFVNYDKISKKFDTYCIDRTEIGVIVQKEALSTDAWSDIERDIRNLKAKSRYGVGILNGGRAISVAKNIAVAPSYPTPPTIRIAQ